MSNISFNISTTKPKISYDIKLMKTGKSEYSGTFDLSMPDGDQVITPNEGRVFSKVTVKKPETMVPENIRKGTDIGGVVGTMTPAQPDMLQQLVDLTGKLTGLSGNPTVTNYDFLENLDTSKVTNFSSLFYNDSNLERVPETWNTSNVISFNEIFRNCYKIIPPDKWDTSNVADFGTCFYFSGGGNRAMTHLPDWDYSKGISFNSFIYNATNIKNITMNIPNATSLINAFNSIHNLENVNLITSEKITDLNGTFASTSISGDINISNTENVKDASRMFINCHILNVNLEKFNFKNVTNGSSFIQGCRIKKVPNIFGDKVVNFSYFAYNAGSLEDCELDMLSCTNSSSMFLYCTNLTNLKLHNIKINTVIGSGTSYGTKLTKESLIFCIKELWSYKDTTTTRTLTMSTPSKTLIADIYVKLITPTREQIEADPYINDKLPCEVCESTDEGAMTITAYANLKNWTIA